MIPKNIFLMWDKPRRDWPPLIALCIDLWIKLNARRGWNVEIFDHDKAWELLRTDISAEVFDTMKVQHQADLVRTKLLSTVGGVWADASCLPHMPVDAWIGEFADCDYASIPSLLRGQISDNWFLVSRKNGFLLGRQYESLKRYWRTPKLNLPQDERSIQMMGENWRGFISHFAAHELRIAPYFLWHYFFRMNLETDTEFAACFAKQPFLNVDGGCGVLIKMLMTNKESDVPNNPMPDDIREFLLTTNAQLSKLNHHSWELNYPLDDFRRCILRRFKSYE